MTLSSHLGVFGLQPFPAGWVSAVAREQQLVGLPVPSEEDWLGPAVPRALGLNADSATALGVSWVVGAGREGPSYLRDTRGPIAPQRDSSQQTRLGLVREAAPRAEMCGPFTHLCGCSL